MAPRAPCPRCRATNKNGQQCKIKTCKYHNYCYIHTTTKRKLLIDKSTIPGAGNGLYTLKDRTPNENITPYLGKRMTKSQFDRKYDNSTVDPQYAVKIRGTNMVIDAQKPPAGMARYANEGNAATNNAKLAKVGKGKTAKVVLKATKPIKVPKQRKGKKEILVNYGETYWDSPKK